MPTTTTSSLDQLVDLLRHRRLSVLTGAGVSTDSGIPDYRGPKTRHIARNPIQHDAFITDAEARRRYWSRASRGYAAVAAAKPNITHQTLAALQQEGKLGSIITQNVDGLHQAAGAEDVLELHGSLHAVSCLACAKTYPRAAVQELIERDNLGWLHRDVVRRDIAPDGDLELAATAYARFLEPRCPNCAGPLMPDVVFFGGCVPKIRTQHALDQVEQSDGLLVIGSSLTVFSGYRFVRFAERLNLPIAIVTLGATRGDKHAAVKVDAPLAEVMPQLAEALALPTRVAPHR